MNNNIPKYNLEALKKDLVKVEEELIIFKKMTGKLLKRKLELEMLIDTIKEREEKNSEG